MEDPDDFQRIDTRPLSMPFGPESLHAVHELNQRLIDILLKESQTPSGASPAMARLSEQLAALTSDVRDRLATLPVSLIDAGFKLEKRWIMLAAGDRHEDAACHDIVLPRSRALEIAPLLYGMVASTAHTSRESAQLIFGMCRAAAEAFATFSVPVVQWLSQARAHWICPRWHDRPEMWQRLIALAARPEQDRLPPVAVLAVNQLLADLELATSVSGESHRIRP